VWPDDVRVRHLLAHTSGFDSALPGGNARFGDGDDALFRCVAELPSARRFVRADDIWSYASSGYWLVGHLAAQRADAPFEAALAGHVLQPAALESTSFAEPDLLGTGRDVPPPPYPRARRPSGGLTSTVDDLLRFARSHLADPASARMRVVHGKPVGGVYGLGLHGERVGAVDVWGHSGSYGGFQSSLLTIPERGAIFVGLTNSDLGAKALRLVEDVFFERAIGEGRAVPDYHHPHEGELAAVAGTYEHTDGRYVVEAVEDELVLHTDDGEHVARKIGPRTFRITGGDRIDERFDFPRDGFGRFGSRLAERVP
jgi:CubicO group peptidase (beta-lactamase class C family)